MKKLLIVYIALCIVCTIFNGRQTTEIFNTEYYGLSTDDTVELSSETELECMFDLTEENLHGIQIKFQADKKFSDEVLRCTLYNAENNEMLAENEVYLKYERIQNTDSGSTIFFYLPIEKTDFKHVRMKLELIGSKKKANIRLVLSESNVHDSKLIVDGIEQKGNLVFSIKYSEGFVKNWGNAVSSGIILVLLGIIVYVWINSGKWGIQQEKPVTEMQTFTDLSEHRSKKFLFAGCLVTGFFVSVLSIYVYKYSVDVFGNLDKAYAIFSVLCLMTAVGLFYFCVWKRRNIETVFAVTALCCGIIMSLVIGLYTVPDEPSHIDTAYSVSNDILGIPESNKIGYLYKRTEDADMTAEDKQSLSADSYRRLYKNLFKKAGDETLVECAVRSNLNNAGKIFYFPQAVGITVGRLLHWGMMPTMMLGRLLNLFAYIILTYFAIRKIPFGKCSLAIIGLLPISLQQAASFSYDSLINAMAFLFIAFTLPMIFQTKEERKWDIIVIMITGIMIAMIKGGVYVALCTLPMLVLFVRKDMELSRKKCIVFLCAVFVFAFAKEHLIWLIDRMGVEAGTIVGGSKSTQVYTFSFILENPLTFLGMFLNTFYKQGDAYLRNLLGGNLAWREVNINWSIMVAVLIVVLMSCLDVKQDAVRLSKEVRIYLGLMCFAIFCCIELSMFLVWTPTTIKYITGVQGRYFLPFFPILLILLRTSFISVKKNIDRILIYFIALLNILVFYQVLQKVLVLK